MEDAFCHVYGNSATTITLTEDEHKQISADAEQLQSWDWLFGPKLPFSFACEDRFSWGSIRMELQVESGCIVGAQIYSDAMQWDLAEIVSSALAGCRFSLQSMCNALQAHSQLQEVAQDLCTLLTQQEL